MNNQKLKPFDILIIITCVIVHVTKLAICLGTKLDRILAKELKPRRMPRDEIESESWIHRHPSTSKPKKDK